MGRLGLRKNLPNVLLLCATLVASTMMVSWAVQQIDFIVAPLIHAYALNSMWYFPTPKGGWFAIPMLVPDAYVRMWFMLYAGLFLLMAGEFVAIWYWRD